MDSSFFLDTQGSYLLAFRGELAEDQGISHHVVDRVTIQDVGKVKRMLFFGDTYSLSAKLSKGPCLSMILTAAS